MYSKYWDSTRDDFSERPAILFQEEHLPYLDDCMEILDLGCGNGALVEKLINQGKKAYGLTYNINEVESAKARRNIDLIYGDMQNLPVSDNEFDAFVMWDSLEHCPSAYIALCEAKRVLKDYGKGLIFMPGQNWLNCHCHICCYTVPQMIQLCKQAGLSIVSIFEKKYPDNSNRPCEGMAVYYIRKDPHYKAVFSC